MMTLRRTTENVIVERVTLKLDSGEDVAVDVAYARADGKLIGYDAGCPLSRREIDRLDAMCREKTK
jgi:hypothetical protein